MRILASNPDTLGDFVLRQPLYDALQRAGHELMLIVRPPVAPLVRHVAPGAILLTLPHEPYANDLGEHWHEFADLFAAARGFAPDLLLVAPYRWTGFEEKLAAELPGVRTAGMDGHLYAGDPAAGLPPPASALRFDVLAGVGENAYEVDKNAALAAAVLGPGGDGAAGGGPPPALNLRPRLAAGGDLEARAAEILRQLGGGFEPGGYWVACVTGTAHVSLKAWPAEKWAHVLSRWADERGRRFLFVGLPEEEPVVREIQRLMWGTGAAHTAVWMPPGGTVDELIGLTALSAGYVGHDTGPMHLAAALGKPTLAVFGGGHKLRFQPAVEPSVTLTVGVACAGCAWTCAFETSHCVKDVPAEAVWQAALDLEEGRVAGREARVLEPGGELQARMLREARDLARVRLRQGAELSRRLESVGRDWERDVADLRAQAEAARAQVEASRGEAAERGAEARALAGELSARSGEVHALRAALEGAGQRLAGQDEALQARQELLERQDAELRNRDALLQEQDAGLRGRDEQIRLGAEQLAAVRDELERLRTELEHKGVTAAALADRLAARTGEAERLAAEMDAMTQRLETVQADRQAEAARHAAEAGGQAEEITKLREQLRALEARVGAMEPNVKAWPAPRRPLRTVLTEWVVGRKEYVPPRRRRVRPLPGVSVVTTVGDGQDAGGVRHTVESVLAQRYAHLEYVVVDRSATVGGAAAAVLKEYEDRIDTVLTEPGATAGGAEATGLSAATGDVLAVLGVGDVYEPGAVLRAGEFFAANPHARAVQFDDVNEGENGWRFPAPPKPTLDVNGLLAAPEELRGDENFDCGDFALFFTRNAYLALGGHNRERGRAAGWDLLVRLARRFGVERGEGHARAVRRRPRPPGAEREAERLAFAKDVDAARESFRHHFGWPGRLRCSALHGLIRLDDALRRRREALHPLSFPPGATDAAPPLPGAEPPAFAPGQPRSPLGERAPDRLLFSSRDTAGGDRGLHYVYYDSAGGAAVLYPPMTPEKVGALYEAAHGGGAKQVTPPPPGVHSPFAGYGRGITGALGRLLMRVPSPYWWTRRPEYGDTAADDVVRLLAGVVPARRGADNPGSAAAPPHAGEALGFPSADSTVEKAGGGAARLPGEGPAPRVLVVGCYDGRVLDELKARTDWALSGTETNPAAAKVAREKGYTVWEVSAQDAPLVIPVGEPFDVIYFAHPERSQNPLIVLRRLKQLLAPGGHLVLTAPNLDSQHAKLFGPTWSGWRVPYHRTLFSRRGLKRLAAAADFKVIRLRTRTDPYPAALSVQLNELGLGAVVPDTARFPDEVAGKGVKLTGWSRMLWDWRGKGDFLFAVLRSE